jgi:hypothetical protein
MNPFLIAIQATRIHIRNHLLTAPRASVRRIRGLPRWRSKKAAQFASVKGIVTQIEPTSLIFTLSETDLPQIQRQMA